MKETTPTIDMGSSGGPRPEVAKTVMAETAGQQSTPPSLPRQGGGPQPWAPPPAPAAPPPPAAPPQFQAASAASASSKTMLMAAPAPKIPLAWLGVVSGPGAECGRTFVLRSETVVGRTTGDWVLGGDSTISSQHVKVRLEPKEGGAEDEQVFMLYDLASANGTFVGTRGNYREDSNRVYRRELHNGDYILVGETTLVFLEA